MTSQKKSSKNKNVTYHDLDEFETISSQLKLISKDSKWTDDDRISQWILTLNTNVSPVDTSHEQRLRTVLKETFEEYVGELSEPYSQYIDSVGGKSKRITKTETDYATEVGENERGGRVHLHGVIELTHKGSIHINYPKSRQFFEKSLVGREGCKGVYVHWAVNRPKSEILRYLSKQKTSKLKMK